MVARDVQRRDTVLPDLVDCRVGAEEQPNALDVALLARDVQRRGAVLLGLVDRRAGLRAGRGESKVADLLVDVLADRRGGPRGADMQPR